MHTAAASPVADVLYLGCHEKAPGCFCDVRVSRVNLCLLCCESDNLPLAVINIMFGYV